MGKMPTDSLCKSSELKLHCFCLFDAYSMPKDMCSVVPQVWLNKNYSFGSINNFDIKSETINLTISCNFLILKSKKQPYFFLGIEADFFDPLLSQKTFATNSMK